MTSTTTGRPEPPADHPRRGGWSPGDPGPDPLAHADPSTHLDADVQVGARPVQDVPAEDDPAGPERDGVAGWPSTGGDGPRHGRPFRGPLAGLVRGRPEDASWVRPALLTLLVATGVLYIWGLGASGWANSFYSAAAQAGSVSWKALFFGSSDAANSITVDKPPVALWLMGLSARIFGVNSWSILVPEALAGVASVGVLYASVRRAFTPAAGLIAGLVLATTPVATLMFRFNNPDALLVLLLVGAAYATLRAVEAASTRWLVLAGVLIGAGFLTKMLQALLIVPVLALVYLVAAPTGLRRRIRDVLLAGLAIVLSAGWYIALVELIPASSRPYIGGSQHNSILELTLGYNGFGRLTGDETGSVGGGGAAGGPAGAGGGGRGWGATGWNRLFNSEIGSQISWLLPTALALLVVGLWLTRRAARTDRARAGFVLWGGWLLVTGIIFSEMKGIFHPYYTVALAPAIGALVGMGATELWARRRHPAAAVTMAAVTVLSVVWCSVLLGRVSGWNSWLRPTVIIVGVLAALLLLAASKLPSRVALTVALAALIACLLGPTSYALATAATPHAGAIPSAGPAGAGGFGGRGGAPGQARLGQGGPNGLFGGGAAGQVPGGQLPGGQLPGGQLPGGQLPGGQLPGGQLPGAPGGQAFGGFPGGTGTGGATRGRMGGGMGGLLGSTTPSAALVTALKQDSSSYTWVAAAVGSNNASGYQLATGDPVMAIGGFNGSDPSPTLAQFQAYVAAGRIHYFVGGGQGGGLAGGSTTGGSNSSASIAAWVQATYKATTIGGTTVYDLTAPATAAASATATGGTTTT